MSSPNNKDPLASWPEVKKSDSVWGPPPDDQSRFPGTSKYYRRFIVLGVVILVAAIAGTAFYFYQRSQIPNVSLEFSSVSQVLVGQPFTLTVSFSNYSDKVLKDAKLSLSLPDGVIFVGQTADQRVRDQLIGDVAPGTLNRSQDFTLITTGGAQSLKRLNAKLNFADPRSDSVRYDQAASTDLQVGQYAIDLKFDTPTNIYSGQKFTVVVKYENNTNQDYKNLHLKIDYPPVFQFATASSTPTRENNYWDLPTLPAGESGSIGISGNVIAPQNSFFTIGATLTYDVSDQTYTIATQTANLGLASAPLSLDISNNNDPNHIAHVNDTLQYVLKYKNNSDTPMQNVTIQATLVGDMFDFTTLRSDASFNSLSHTFSWVTANTPRLASIDPGEEGSVGFSVTLKDAFPIKRLSDKNYTLKVQGQIQSPTVPAGTTADNTMSVANIETKVGGHIVLLTKAYWRDAASGFVNSGPFPPKVNQPTQYTMHWLITNYATDVNGVTVAAFLQSGARWTGKVKSTIQSVPTYDPSTGQVTWNVGSVAATKGVISAPIEAVFQIEVTPAVNQIGQEVPLLGDSTLQGADSFTNESFTSTAQALTSQLPDDTTISPQTPKQVQQ